MPTLEAGREDKPVKLLLYGDSGGGKTGCLAALANAGQRLAVVDYDNGIDVLFSYIKPEFHKNVYYVTLQDKLRGGVAGSPYASSPLGMPTAITRGMALLDNWVDGDIKLGSIRNWKRDTTLVIDSLTMMGHCAIRYIRAVNGRVPTDPTWISDWGQAMKIQESMLEMLYDSSIQCNVVVTSHIVMIGGDAKTGDGAKGLPSALGSKLPPVVPRYFNNTLRAVTSGGDRRVLRSFSTTDLELKNTNPEAVPKELPLATGLVDFFTAVGGEVRKYERGE